METSGKKAPSPVLTAKVASVRPLPAEKYSAAPEHACPPVIRQPSSDLLLFYQVICTIDFNFWRAIGSKKLGEWKLETPRVPLLGSLVPLETSQLHHHRVSSDGEATASASSGFGWRLHLDEASLTARATSSNAASDVNGSAVSGASVASSLKVKGFFCNVNSMDDFKRINRTSFIDEVIRGTARDLSLAQACLCRDDLDSEVLLEKPDVSLIGENVPSLLRCLSPEENLIAKMSTFLILSYADLKNHLYYYNVALPTLRPTQDFRIAERSPVGSLDDSALLPQLCLSPSIVCQIGEALFRSPQVSENRLAGLSAICVLLKRGEPDSCDIGCSGHWLDQLHDAARGLVEGSAAHFFSVKQLDEATILLPLYLVLLHLHKRQSSSGQPHGTARTQGSKSFPLLQSQRTSGAICFIDSVRGDGTALGWPIRSSLFALGALGLAGGLLTFFAYRDGISGTIRQSTTTGCLPEGSRKSNSVIFNVIMPSAEHFDVTALIAMDAAGESAKAADASSDRPDDACGSPPLSPQPDLACALTQDELPLMMRRQRLRSDSNLEAGRGSSLLSPALSYSCRSVRETAVAGWHRRISPPEQSDQHAGNSGASDGGTHRSPAGSITFVVDLKKHLDPIASQSDAVDLNLRLIQWRILPKLNLARLQGLRFLVFGVGTLGCHVLRNLVGWGFREFTLVDCGKVALSSPVRQCLFTYEDAVWGRGQGRSKVAAAKDRLLQIRHGLLINTVEMEIPMPGHPRFLFHRGARRNCSNNGGNAAPGSAEPKKISASGKEVLDDEELFYRIRLIERLVDAHDVVLLLTDSRESRWLPSMLVSSRCFRPNSNVIADGKTSRFRPPPPWPGESCKEQRGTPSVGKRAEGCQDGVQTPRLNAADSNGSQGETEGGTRDTLSAQAAWNRLFTSPTTYETPLCMSVAVGFDSFVVIRHGQRSANGSRLPAPSSNKAPSRGGDEDSTLACYFCNDLSAPGDSSIQRPLDEQCTVTRPGISGLAASIATELFLSVTQHPDAPHCSHDAEDSGAENHHHSCLGAVPHTVRGSLGSFELVSIGTSAFKHCIACSVPVLERYCRLDTEKESFISEVIARSEILEEVSGLAAMKMCQRENEVTILSVEEDALLQPIEEMSPPSS